MFQLQITDGSPVANSSYGRVFARCNKIISGSNKVVAFKNNKRLENVDTSVDVVKPVDDVKEGEGEGEYYP